MDNLNYISCVRLVSSLPLLHLGEFYSSLYDSCAFAREMGAPSVKIDPLAHTCHVTR